MLKKLVVRTILFLLILLGGIGTLITMDLLGSDIPFRLVSKIVQQLPAQKPDSYFVPTPLPVAPQSTFVAPAIVETEVATDVDHLEMNEGASGNVEQSGLAVVAATSTPVSMPTNPPNEQSVHTNDSGGQNNATVSTVADINSESTTQQSDEAQTKDSPVQSVSHQAPPPTPSVALTPIAPFKALEGFNHEWQTWNNCGPATLAMNLSFFGSSLLQAEIASVLRQHEDDKNVTPTEMAQFAQAQGYHAQVRVNGSAALLKLLLSNQIPVLIETWMEPDPNDGMGHYRLLTGYDDEAQHWIAFDSYVSHDFVRDAENYEGITLPYGEMDPLWRVFNRTYLLVYDDSKSAVVQAIFGESLDPQVMWQQSLITAQNELAQEAENPFVWFNLGSTYNALGNHAEAATAFDQARRLGLPWRMLWYQFGPFEAYYETGRYDEVLALAYATIANTESIEEIHYWKGRGLAATGNLQSAKSAWQQALTLNPSYQKALDALAELE